MRGDSRGGVKLVALQPEHVSAVAHLHGEALSGDFLPSLGPGFLRTMYASILELRLAFCIVAVDAADQVVGFVMATEDSRSLFRQIVARRFFQLARQVGAVLLHRPQLIT